jgi:hypothetical protein
VAVLGLDTFLDACITSVDAVGREEMNLNDLDIQEALIPKGE